MCGASRERTVSNMNKDTGHHTLSCAHNTDTCRCLHGRGRRRRASSFSTSSTHSRPTAAKALTLEESWTVSFHSS